MATKLTPMDRANRFVVDLHNRGIEIDASEVDAIKYAFEMAYTGDAIKSKYNIHNRLLDMFLYDNIRKNRNYYDRLVAITGHSLTKEKMILRYGEEEGNKRWKSYCDKQSYTNTFEYKHKKYGMTREQFDKYNKSRSVTLEHLVAKHGEEVGKKMWKKYLERQAYAGCKLEYFIEKYGETDGVQMYNSVNEKKRHTLKTVMDRRKCSREEAIAWLCNYYGKRTSREMYSRTSQIFIKKVLEKIDLSGYKLYYGETEFGMWSNRLDKYVKYDLTIEKLKLIFEYDGDYYHANPNKYRPDDFISYASGVKEKVKNIWLFDAQKEKTAIDNGYEVCRIWESDFLNDEEKTINRCVSKIKEKIDECSQKNE